MSTKLLTQTEQTGKGATPKRVLFVCTGNTCRSPMAAAWLNHREAQRGIPRYRAASAGLFAADGAPISTEAHDALLEAGVTPTPENDFPAHRARTVQEDMIRNADAVVGITARHAFELQLRFPQYASRIVAMPLDIADPFGGDQAIYRATLAELSMAIDLLFDGEAL